MKLSIAVPTAIAAFVFATLVLGELANFYERFWWWDIAMHAVASAAFGAAGIFLLLFLVDRRKVLASPGVGALLAFCFALSVGALWEIIEYVLDQMLGLNMQKSGLPDTMSDLMVDCVGALLVAIIGYVRLRKISPAFNDPRSRM